MRLVFGAENNSCFKAWSVNVRGQYGTMLRINAAYFHEIALAGLGGLALRTSSWNPAVRFVNGPTCG